MALLRVLRNLQVSQARRKHPPATTSWFRVAPQNWCTHYTLQAPVGWAAPILIAFTAISDKKVAFALRGVPLRAIPDQ
jgi:hypothetical protein